MAERITLRLTPTEGKALDQIVMQHGYKSRSDAIRDALSSLFEFWKLKPEARQRIRTERLERPARRRDLPGAEGEDIAP